MTLLALLIGFGVWVDAATDPRCPSKDHVLMDEQRMTPVDFGLFIERNNLKDPGEVTCCMPLSYRKNFVVAHSSISAQSSDIHGPRILMFNPINPDGLGAPTKKLNAVISINGGGPNLTNGANVEMGYVNSESKELDFHDFDLSGAKVIASGRNPARCIQCHGTRGVIAAGGAKPIFEPLDQWTRFVGGVHSCGAEIDLRDEIMKSTLKTLTSNPRYRCLDPSDILAAAKKNNDPVPFFKELTDLDHALSVTNARRFARYLKTTPDYDRFKYAAIGTMACVLASEDEDKFENENRDLGDWIPPQVNQSLRNVSAINSDLLKAQPLEAARVLLQRSEELRLKFGRRQARATQDMVAGKDGDLDFYRGPLSNCHGNGTVKMRMAAIKHSLVGPSTLDLYKIDSATRGFRG